MLGKGNNGLKLEKPNERFVYHEHPAIREAYRMHVTGDKKIRPLPDVMATDEEWESTVLTHFSGITWAYDYANSLPAEIRGQMERTKEE